METVIYIIYLVILFAIAKLLEPKQENFNSYFTKSLYDFHKETDIKNGFIGKHDNIYKKGNKDYHISSKYNFNITAKDKRELKKIMKPILKKVNKDMNLEFQFLDFEHVTTQFFNDGTKRYIIDCFIHETNKYYDKRIIVDVIVKNKTVFVNNMSIGNGNIEKTSDKKSTHKFSPKIICDSNLKNTNTVIGNEEEGLEYNIISNKPINYIGTDRNFTKWIVKDTKKREWPCRLQGENWNSNSVNETTNKTGNCTGIDSSYNEVNKNDIQIPNFNPTFKNIEQKDQYNWLWGKSRGTGTNMFSGGSG